MIAVPGRARARFSIVRHYATTIDEAWWLWTAKAGIESWWGPEGFTIAVISMDLRVGGKLNYLMTATAPDQVAYMQHAGLPISAETTVTYTDVSPQSRLAYTTLSDFVPDMPPYEIATVVNLKTTRDGVELTIEFDAMHNDEWTARARAGHESQLRKLDTLLATAP